MFLCRCCHWCHCWCFICRPNQGRRSHLASHVYFHSPCSSLLSQIRYPKHLTTFLSWVSIFYVTWNIWTGLLIIFVNCSMWKNWRVSMQIQCNWVSAEYNLSHNFQLLTSCQNIKKWNSLLEDHFRHVSQWKCKSPSLTFSHNLANLMVSGNVWHLRWQSTYLSWRSI